MSDVIRIEDFQVNSLTGASLGGNQRLIKLNMDYTRAGAIASTIIDIGPGTSIFVQQGKPGYGGGTSNIAISVSGDGHDDVVNGIGISQIDLTSATNSASYTNVFTSYIDFSNQSNDTLDTNSFSNSSFAAQTAIGGVSSIGGFGLYAPNYDYTNIRAYISSKWVGIGDGYENAAGFDATNTVSIKAAVSIDINSPLININGLTVATSGSAGSASALPATPAGYLPVTVGGTAYVIPLYLP